MKLSYEWLLDYVDPRLDPDALAERLSLTGTEVEAVRRLGIPDGNGNLDAFRVGKVLQVEAHPNADRLRVCRVDLGEAEPRQIVCGAPNVADGQTVAVALPGARLPGDRPPLEAATLRGVESAGMILSEAELELGEDRGGIMVLPEGPAPGSPLSHVVPIADAVLDLELTSNRPDCAAVWGMAQEVHALTERPLVPLDESDPPAEGTGSVEDYATLRVEAPDLCPRYMARVFTDIEVGSSPGWLRRRLEASGMRPISNVVDVTNYVMLLTGQPLHAFDLDRVEGAEIVVRRAAPGEPITTLDGHARKLEDWMLAICDAKRPAVVAGIMGAEDVEVSESTTRVLLEAATFDGPTTLHASLSLGLRSESSGRFEKGLPAELPPRAIRIASRMLVELCGARMVPGTLDAAEPISEIEPVRLRHERQRALLGAEIPATESADILRRLGFEVTEGDEAHTVTPPFERRRDVTREADLIEEVVRVAGLDRVPAELPRLPADGRRTPQQSLRLRLSERAIGIGLSETVAYRFVPPTDSDLLRLAGDDSRRQVVSITNPISEEMAVMRRTLLPGLLRAVAVNQSHQRRDGGLFEIGRTYAPRSDGQADEAEQIACILFGRPGATGWRHSPEPVDVFSATGLAVALAATARVRLTSGAGTEPYLHPVRQAELTAEGRAIGVAGEVHPLVLQAAGIDGPLAFVSLSLADILAAQTAHPEFEDLISVPVSTRDLAVLVPDDLPSVKLIESARSAGAPLVRSAEIFDRYVGEQVAEGNVGLAIRLTLVDPGRTLTDDEIDAAVGRVVGALADLGATLRE